MIVDSNIFIETIDRFLTELGTTSVVDARKARDQLMDLRLMLMASLVEAPNTIESIAAKEDVL